MEIKDSHFLITGGNRGIGRAVAFMAAKEGAHLYLVNRTSSERARLERELLEVGARSVKTIEADLSSASSLETVCKSIQSLPLNIVFNNAGQLVGGILETQSVSEIDQMLAVNLTAVIHITRAALPGMHARKNGMIINNSSVSAVMPFPGASTYAATKAAVLEFTRCLHYELKGTGVKALALITPSIKTRMLGEIPKKFGSFLQLQGLGGITPEKYALRIRDAILEDFKELKPVGFTRLAYWLAKFCPNLYRSIIQSRFQRPPV